MIYPDYGGASQSCVIPIDPQTRRFRVIEGAVLALGANPPLDQCKTLLVSRQRISIAGPPGTSARIRAVGGMWDSPCWTIPDVPNDKVRHPIDVAPAACQKNAACKLKFFLE
jgi:hypothetical protein